MKGSRIRKDSHGLYVRTGGYIFRPQEAQSSYLYATGTVLESGQEVGETKLLEDQLVKAHHIAQTPHAKVGDEVWASHGKYTRWEGMAPGRLLTIPPEEVWNPRRKS